MLNISLLGSIFYILFKILEKLSKNNLTSNFYYKLSKIIALFFIIPISYILSFYLPDFNSLNNFNYKNIEKTSTINNDININENNIKTNINLDEINILENNENINLNNKITINYLLILKYFYILGIIIFIFINLIFFIKFKILIRKSTLILDTNYNKILIDIRKKLNINKNILIFENKNTFSPMLVGIFNPKIILPKKNISLQDLEFILTHELIHFKRKDLLTKLILLFINIFHFFNPLIYLLIKDIDKWCEYSCDEKLIKIYSNNEKNYCLAILNGLNPIKNKNIYFTTTFASSKNNLKRRLENIMTEHKPKNKFRITLTTSIFTIGCIIFILVFSIFYSNNKINVFAKSNFTREFDEPTNFYYKNFPPEKEDEKELALLDKTPKVQLKGSFINEEPTSVDQMYLNFYLSNFSMTGSSTDNYVKIEIENIGKHKDDPNNTYDLYCKIYGEYHGYDLKQEKKVYLDTITIPKNEKVTYVFETIKPFTRYGLEFNHKYYHAPSFNAQVTTANKLEDLGVDSITNLSKEGNTYLIETREHYSGTKGVRQTNLDVGNYNNLDLQFKNTTNEELSLIFYDISDDIFTPRTMSVSETISREYKISPNETFNEIFKNAKAKNYQISLIPTRLKDDYLKIQKLEDEIYKSDTKNINKEKELDKLNKVYIEEYENIMKNQKDNLYYKCYN